MRRSVELNSLALRALHDVPNGLRVPGLPGAVLSQLMRSASFVESRSLGLLMFTPSFVRLLLEQDYRDARERREELAAFFAA